MGHLQALVLCKLLELGKEACGFRVLEGLSLDSGVWMDHSQIYATIRKLADKEFIVHVETRKQTHGPPLKIYQLTAAGRAALDATTEHHSAVAEFLNNKRKAART